MASLLIFLLVSANNLELTERGLVLEVLHCPGDQVAMNVRDIAFSSLVGKARSCVEVIQGIYRENALVMTMIETVSSLL